MLAYPQQALLQNLTYQQKHAFLARVSMDISDFERDLLAIRLPDTSTSPYSQIRLFRLTPKSTAAGM